MRLQGGIVTGREEAAMGHRTPFGKVLSLVSIVVALTGVAAIVLGLSVSGHSQAFSVMYNFTGSVNGAYPLAGVTIDRTGNLYTAASMGGLSNRGAVCKLTHQGSGWTIRSLYSFGGPPDAATPIARIVIGPDGSLYGTTEFGGRNCGGNAGCGTVYRLQPPLGLCRSASCPWTETL